MGLCVTDLERAREVLRGGLGFRYWFEFGDLPEDDAAQLLMLGTPLSSTRVYLIRDGLVLELLDYHLDRMHPARERSMAEPGLTHVSVTVGDLAAAFERVERCGGTVLQETNTGPAVMVRDPDGQLIELLDQGWLEMRPPLPVTM